MSKLSLNEFRIMKDSMISIIKSVEQLENSNDNDNSNIKKQYDEYLNKYISLQKELLQYDLSDISFEEWQGIVIIEEGGLDFSKTHANLDFSLIVPINDVLEDYNLQGCQVKGIEAMYYDDTVFDNEYMNKHPEYFPDNTIPDEVRQSFYHHNLTFYDLEKYPSLLRCTSEHSFQYEYRKLFEIVGFNNVIRFFKENSVFFNTFIEFHNLYRFEIDSSFDRTSPYEEVKKFIYKQIIDNVKKNNINIYVESYDIFPQEMIDYFPNVFIKDGELPDYVTKDYYGGNLEVSELRDHSEVLKNKDLELGTRNSFTVKAINKVFGDVWNFIKTVPVEYQDLVELYIYHHSHDEEVMNELTNQDLSTIISKSIINSLSTVISTSIFNSLNFEPIKNHSLDELYAYSEYVSLEELFKDEKLRIFIKKCGFKNIVEFNKAHNGILELNFDYDSKLLQEMSKYLSSSEIENIAEGQQLQDIFQKIIHEMRENYNYNEQFLDKNNRQLSEAFPSEFINYNIADIILKDMEESERKSIIKDLKCGFDGSIGFLSSALSKKPELIQAIINSNIRVSNNIGLRFFYEQVGKEKYLEICSKYGFYLSENLESSNNNHIIAEFLTKIAEDDEDYSMPIIQYIYYLLNESDNKKFDIRVLSASFKNKYPELFLDENAPEELKNAFYTRSLTPFLISHNPEYAEYLKGKNIGVCFKKRNVKIGKQYEDIYSYLSERMSINDFYDFIFDYADIIEQNENVFYNEINFNIEDNSGEIIKVINEKIRNLIIKKYISYANRMPEMFKNAYPNMFLSNDAPQELKDAFYNRSINSEYILSNPKYLEYLKGIDLEVLFKYMPVDYIEGNDNKVNFVNIVKQKFGLENGFELMLLYGKYIEAAYEAGSFGSFKYDLNVSKVELLDDIDNHILDAIINDGIKYDENIPDRFKQKNPTLFLDSNVSSEIKEKFYNREFTLKDFNDNPDLIDLFANTNIACGFSGKLSWIIPLFNNIENSKIANYNRLKVISAYSKIPDIGLQSEFKDFIKEKINDIEIEKVEFISDLLSRISMSNSSEIFNFRKELAFQLLNSENPLDSLNKIESVFIKNNIPTVGKLYSCFEILHPDFQGFDFNDSKISPALKKSTTTEKKIIVFSDLIKSAFGSNNRSVNAYLRNIEIGSKLFDNIRNGQIEYNNLSHDEQNELNIFRNHLATLYNNTLQAKRTNTSFIFTNDIYADILDLSKKISPNGTLDYNLGDRVIRMFCGFTGIDTLEQAKAYINKKILTADTKNRVAAESDIKLDQGDFIKGIGDITYLSQILQNGSLSKEYLGASSGSDSTPLDTDVSMVMSSVGSISDKISNTAANGYGPIWLVLKNDDRFITTRTSNKNCDVKRDLSKLEVFYTGVVSQDHYGIRTGFASSEIDYIVMETYDPRVGLEIAMNGFYIPVANKEGKIVFTPDDYDKLRKKMNGLSYYGMSNFAVDESKNRYSQEVEDTIISMNKGIVETQTKSRLIWNSLSAATKQLNLTLQNGIDLSSGSLVLFNTGSTGRYTNLPGDGDFDYTMQVDRSIYESYEKMSMLQNAIIESLSGGKQIEFSIVGDDIRELKTTFIDEDGNSHDVEIDITFTVKTDKVEYASDVCVSDRLNSIKDPKDRDIVKANIVLAKQLLKGIEAYKPARKFSEQGGMGGIGVENWILQNGGTLYRAAKSFMEIADHCSSFEEFQSRYSLPNFGFNHMAIKKDFYPHDDYISNMNGEGYAKMKKALSTYIKKYETQAESPVLDTITEINNMSNLRDKTFVSKKCYYNDSELIKDSEQILCASFDIDNLNLSNVQMGQTGKMYELAVESGTYLVKPGVNKNDGTVRPARAEVQEAASKLQEILIPDRFVQVRTYGTGNLRVAVQKKVENAKNVSETELITKHTTELLGEYVVDFLLGNFDSDASNFIIDEHGLLRGIDKEQSFKYLLDDVNGNSLDLNFSYQPVGSRPNVYPQLLNYIRENELSEECSNLLNDIKFKLENISDDEYQEMFKKYAYSYDANRANKILNKILMRKSYFLNNIDEFFNNLNIKCSKSV